MTNQRKTGLMSWVLVLFHFFAVTEASAKVSEQEAKRLQQDLTPVGAQRAGNDEGTIPPWNGGVNQPPSEWKAGTIEVDPFAVDRPLFTITAEQMTGYAKKLTPGQQALLKAYPASYQLPVYKTHRSAAYPERVYAALAGNAVTAELLENGNGVKNTMVTSPFPIPGNGIEAIWNHVLRFRGEQVEFRAAFATPMESGAFTPILTNYEYYFTYSEPNVSLEEIENKVFYLRTEILAPSQLAGTLNLIHETLDQVRSPRMAWRYQAGERRLRRSPNLDYSTDLPNSSSLRAVDQKDLYNGAPDQYEWTLQGKREIYVPYNSYKLHQAGLKPADIIRPHHINQDLARYELHRVWVVEGILRVGMPHIYGRRVFYIDEDSWQILLTEEYDREGQLWRVSEAHPVEYYSVPLFWTTLELTYDLKAKRYFIDGLDNDQPPYNFSPGLNRSAFSTSSARRAARR